MSQENVELLRRVYDAFNRRDIDCVIALCAPEVEFTSRILEVEGGDRYRGHDGVRTWWKNVLGVSPDLRTDIDEIRDLGDVTVTRLRVCGHGTQSKAPMEQIQWEVTGWRNEKIVWWGIYLSEAQALEAAGLRG